MKRITAGIRGAPKSLSQQKTQPQLGSVPGLDAVEQLVHAGLVTGDEQGRLLPQLAEVVPSIENGLWTVFPDGRMTTTWRIKDAARWQDGVPVTANDLLFAVRVEQDRDLAIPRHAVYNMIEQVEASDTRTITVTWKETYIEAPALFTAEVALPLPSHLLSQAYADDKAGFLGLPYWTQEFVGAGPYQVQDWVLDSHVVLRANAQYILGRPRIDEIEVRFIPDPNTLFANLLAGTELTLGRALPLDLDMDAEWKARGGQVAYRGGSWVRVVPQFVNATPPVVADLRFRRAMLHAIDRQQMVESLVGGLSTVAHAFVEPGSPEHGVVAASAVQYDFDLKRSVQLLEELGYRRGGDGLIRDAAGVRVAVEFQTTAQNLIHPKALAIVAADWEQLGVAVDQVVIPIQRSQDAEYRASFPAFELSGGSIDVTSRGVQRYHSSSTPLPENRFQNRGNEARYMNPQLDALIERYVTTIPWPARTEALAQIVRHQSEQVTLMGLFYRPTPTFLAARLINVTAGNGAGAVRSTEAWNAHAWDVK